MKKTKKYNWSKIRNEYIQSYISMEKLCLKYNIPLNTMLSRASKQNEWWTEQRREYRKIINNKSIEQAAEKEAIEIQSMKEKERKQIALLEQLVLSNIIKDNKINYNLLPYEIASLSVVLERCQKMKYKSYGISENVNIKGELVRKEIQEIKIISDATIEESIKILGEAGIVSLPTKNEQVH